MELQDLQYTKDGHIAIITLDREQSRNAYSYEMIDSLEAAFNAAQDDDDVRCVILTGAGRAFSAGGDLKQMKSHTGMFEGDAVRLRTKYVRGIHRVPHLLLKFDKPIVAALNGAAIGAGLDLACMCDIRISNERAKYGSTFVKIGLVPGDGGAFFLSRIVGMPRAVELILTGRVIDAQKALEIGLVHEVVPQETLLERAKEVALEIAANAPIAVRLAKTACYQAYEVTAEQALSMAATYQGIAQNTADHDEGVNALLEKRAPVFKNK